MIEPKNKGGGSHAGPPHSSVTAAANDQATVPTQSAEPVKPVVDESVNLKLAAEIEREANEIAELKKKNDQKDKFGKGKKGKKEKKTKVKNSPVKSKETDLAVETETRCECEEDCDCERFDCVFCPCADFSVAQESIQCTVCYVWFHVVCANLRGLTGLEIEKMERWSCCTCWAAGSPLARILFGEILPDAVKGVAGVANSTTEVTLEVLAEEIRELKSIVTVSQISSGPAVSGVRQATRGSGELNCHTVGLMMKEQLNLQVPVIAARVKDVMDAGVKKIVDSYAEQKKTYAEMSKGLEEKVAKSAKINKEMVEDVVKSGNVEQAKKTEANLNLEAYERLKRKQNVIVRGVPESNSDVIATRIEHDLEWIIHETDIVKDDIVRCYRPGQRKKDKPRPLICVLKTEEMVQQYTNFGRGSKIGEGNPKDSYFVNLDLSPADQEADFLARKANSERKKQEQK